MSILVFKSKKQRAEPQKSYWTNQDIADFYRAKDILEQAGLNTETDHGITDEGDPWFVFIRPETGDVIAHFAQIDGQFLAVSSLNQEVYQGEDIRGIVDRMLERHPMLLPQNKNGARLLLHPTAALSAFLAAAFILSIDGVKASDLTTVMIAARTQNIKDITNETGLVDNNLKGDLYRATFSDLDPTNYNVAVLGVALIAYELYHKDLHFNEDSGVGDSAFGLNSEENKFDEENSEDIVISMAKPRDASGEIDENNSLQDPDLNINERDGDQRPSQSNNADVKNKKVIIADFVLIESPAETSHSMVQNLAKFWVNDDPVPGAKFKSSREVETVSIDDNTEKITTFDAGANDEVVDISFSALIEQFQDVFHGISNNFELVELSGISSLEVSIDEGGGLRVISLEALGLNNKVAILNDVAFNNSTPLIETRISESNEALNYFEQDNALLGAEEPVSVPSIAQVPIIGHVLADTGDTLELSDAIDVVFYEGGDAEIAKFQLGTDLLWFFLSPEQLTTSKNSVNDRGDLELDFGDLGTLTFFGMLDDPSLDILV